MINFAYNLNKNLVLKRNLFSNKDKNFIFDYQLKKLNEVWKYVLKKYTFYSIYKKENNLPDDINSLNEFNNFPIISKNDIIKNYEIIFNESKTNKNTFTGGTSGPVTRFPTGFIDAKKNFINQAFLRENFEIFPRDKCLYIWGHSHKFNKNLISKFYKELAKKLKNFYFRRLQLSAYDLSSQNVSQIYDHLHKLQPFYILTYASTFSSILNFFDFKNITYENKIKIILTSDNLSLNDYELVKKIFPLSELINEFGMAESGVIGYNKKNEFYKIKTLWDSFLVQSKEKNLIITDLEKRVFPLIRYSPDDLIETDDDISIFEFKISGKIRPSFEIKFKNEYKKISSIIFDHIYKFDKFIRSTQYYWNKDKKKLAIFFTCDSKVEKNYLSNKLISHFGSIPQNIDIFIIHDTIKTKAGKFIYHLKDEDLSKNKINLS